MKSLQRQQGVSFLFWMIIIAILGFAAIIGFKLFPVYLEAYTVETILEDVANEPASKQRNRHQLWLAVSRRFDINNIRDIRKENFTFKREKGKTTFGVKYEVRKHMFHNIDALMSFDIDRSLQQSS